MLYEVITLPPGAGGHPGMNRPVRIAWHKRASAAAAREPAAWLEGGWQHSDAAPDVLRRIRNNFV